MSDSLPDSSSSPQFVAFEQNIEKYSFRGILIAATLHGIVIALFFQSMGALLSPTNRKHKAGGIRWGLVALTTAIFLFSTTALALNLDALSSDYIDHRGDPFHTLSRSLGYVISPGTISVIQHGAMLFSMVSLNQWLADGLLLTTETVVGIVFIYECTRGLYPGNLVVFKIIPLYLAITFSLNVLLTFMIVGRLALCNQEIRAVMGISSRDHMGTSSRAGELYKAIATIFVESCAPYAISLLLYLIARSISGSLADIFYPIFIETQVIAPFLIIIRLANRTAVTSDSTIGSRTVDPARFRSHEETTGSYGAFPDEGPAGSTDVALNELSVGDGMAIEEVPL